MDQAGTVEQVAHLHALLQRRGQHQAVVGVANLRTGRELARGAVELDRHRFEMADHADLRILWDGAQLRTIPEAAQVGVIRHLETMVVELDGATRELSPGAQIRDADNRLVLPTSLQEREQVRYLLDSAGLIHRVWILSAPEKAALPPVPSPFPR